MTRKDTLRAGTELLVIAPAKLRHHDGTMHRDFVGPIGNSNTPVTISFSTGDPLTGPGGAMALNNFRHDAGPTPVLEAGGLLTFNVGADLRVINNQANDLFSAVTVNYQ